MNFLGNFGEQLFQTLDSEYGLYIDIHQNGDYIEFISKQYNILLVLQFETRGDNVIFCCFVENSCTALGYEIIGDNIIDVNNFGQFKTEYVKEIMKVYYRIMFVLPHIKEKLTEIYQMLNKHLGLEVSSIEDLVKDFPIID